MHDTRLEEGAEPWRKQMIVGQLLQIARECAAKELRRAAALTEELAALDVKRAKLEKERLGESHLRLVG